MIIVKQVFDDVSVLALEDWGMALVEPIAPSRDVFPSDSVLYRGCTQFKGIMNGTIAVVCCRQFLVNITRNLLGVDATSEISDSLCKDTLTELVNVFCGNFLTAAYGDDVVFELVFPSVEIASAEQIDSFFKSRLIHCYLADDEPVALALEGGMPGGD